jgi:peptidoglycan/xylan/chitin deacetylase (PgdA/CDA1 family)
VRDDEIIWTSYDEVFAAQMAFLHREGWTTLDLDEYLEIRAGRMTMPPKPVIVTFDDGYLSNYTMAFPVLQEHGLKATIFVSLEPDEYTRKQVEDVDGFLTPGQIREMAEGNVSIQSHTLTHRVMSGLDDDEVRFELTESRRRLEELCGRPVEHLAIPRAGYSRRVKRLVREAGYRTACSNRKGSSTGRSYPLDLPRIVIERDMDLEDFARCLSPRGAVAQRIMGNLKRLPALLGGVDLSRTLRGVLYGGPFGRLFRARNLKRLLAVLALAYLIGFALFLSQLLSR